MCEGTPLLPKPTPCTQSSAPFKLSESLVARCCGFLVLLLAMLSGLHWVLSRASSSGSADQQYSEQRADSCLGIVQQIFIVNMERCENRREMMRDMLQVGNASSPLACVPLRWGVGNVDGSRNSLDEMGRLLGAPQLKDWPQGNPYKPGKHMTRGEYGCAISHYLVYQEIVDMNLPAALILEDDFGFNGNDLFSFTRALQSAVSNLNAARGLDGWDILYVDYDDISTNADDIARIGKFDAGLQHGGCLGFTSAYILSQTGARKLLRFKEYYINHMIPIDDFLMTLGGKNCPSQYDRAAKLAAAALQTVPYKGLNVYSTTRRLSKQSNYLGHLTGDIVPESRC